MAAQEYKKQGDSNTPQTQTASGMAEAVRMQLGNAASTTGGAGFAGAASLIKSEASELAVLQREVQELRRLVAVPKSMFRCSRCGPNNSHDTKDCRGLKRAAEKAERAKKY